MKMANETPRIAKKGDFVQIHVVILRPEERTEKLPECTKKVPYEGWVKGFLLEDLATIGDKVRIRSFIGRELTGTLVKINPSYNHDFGQPQPELLTVGIEAWQVIETNSERES